MVAEPDTENHRTLRSESESDRLPIRPLRDRTRCDGTFRKERGFGVNAIVRVERLPPPQRPCHNRTAFSKGFPDENISCCRSRDCVMSERRLHFRSGSARPARAGGATGSRATAGTATGRRQAEAGISPAATAPVTARIGSAATAPVTARTGSAARASIKARLPSAIAGGF